MLIIHLGAGAAWGQAYLFNHYNRVRIGETGALEGGAFSARADDASAAWYNPAGLAQARADSVSGSATLFESSRVAVAGESALDATNNIGAFVGNVGRVDLLGTPVHWSFSIAAPASWSAVTARRFTTDNADSQGNVFADKLKTTVESTQRFAITAPGVAAGWTAADGVRTGFAIRVYAVDLESGVTQATNQQEGAATQRNYQLVSDQRLRGTAFLMRLEGGAQWDVTEHGALGATVRTASTRLSSSGRVRLRSLSGFDSGGSRVTSSFTIDQTVDFDYRLPLEIGLGGAWKSSRWEAEVDVVHHQAVPVYDLLGATEGQAVSDDGTSPFYSRQKLQSFAVEARAVTNASLGGMARLTENFSLHAGIFVEHAPGAEPKGATVKQVFDQTDLAGVTFGITQQRQGGSTSLGLLYTQGSGREILYDPASQAAVRSTVSVSILGILLAGSVRF